MSSKALLSRELLGGVDPATMITSVAAGVSSGQSYTSPTSGERADAAAGLARLAVGDLTGAAALLGPLGFTTTTDYDPATGRRYSLAVSETATARAWGLYLIDMTAPPALCIAVPHPKSDLHCEQLALRLWRATPGAILAMAAVHRDAASGAADHSQNTTSVFHTWWTTILGPRGVPMVQIHGFADATATEQVVVSTGSTTVAHPAVTRIADEIAATGLVTTRSWDGTGDTDLLATTNVQATAANSAGWVWAHVEHNNTVRTTAALWQKAIDAIAAANPGALALYRPSPGGTGHFPQAAGSANTTGTSLFLAREDHVHRGATTTHAAAHAAGASDQLTPAAIGAQPAAAQYDAEDNASGTTQSTTYTPTLTGATAVGFSFVAPASGKVTILWASQISVTPAAYGFVSIEIRTGGTVGSGTVIMSPTDDYAMAYNSTLADRRTVHRTISGLTAGATYNLRHQHKCSVGTSTATFVRRNATVIPG
jgi:hypothetical protein